MLNQQIGPYKIISKLGEGGMANVYLAEKGTLSKKVALKVLKDEFLSNQHIRNRFLSEAKKMSGLNHANIVGVHDLIDETNFVAIELDFVEGKTLKQHLQENGALPDEEIEVLFKQMLAALAYIHEKGFVHRDVKPSNFMLTNNGVIKLTDFGIAKSVDDSNMDYTGTGTGMQMGTPKYMSPEQVRSTKDVDHRTDIYSLGVVLWEMVTGKVPYDIKTASTFDVFTKIVNEPLEKTNTRWDEVIQKATRKEVFDRSINIIQIISTIGINDVNETKSEEFYQDNSTKNEINKSKFTRGQATLNNIFAFLLVIALPVTIFVVSNFYNSTKIIKNSPVVSSKNDDLDSNIISNDVRNEELKDVESKSIESTIPINEVINPFSRLIQKSNIKWKGIKDNLYLHKRLGTFYRLPVNYVSYGLHESNKAKTDMVLYDSIYGSPLGTLKRNESVVISNYEYHFYDFDKAVVYTCNNTIFDGCKTIIELSPNDTILLLTSAGESSWDVLYKGQLTRATFSNEGWKLGSQSHDGCNMITGRRLSKDGKHILWIKAKLSSGTVGYLKFDDMNESILKYFNVY